MEATRPKDPLFREKKGRTREKGLDSRNAGVGRSDGWSRVLSYSVSPELTTETLILLNSGSVGRVGRGGHIV